MEEVKALLKDRPDRLAVWFNKKGEYNFHPGGEFTEKKTRDQIMGKEEKPKAETKNEKAAREKAEKIESLNTEKANLVKKGKDLSEDEEFRIEEIDEELKKLSK